MNSSLDFIWDPDKDKFNLEFFKVEDYDMNELIMLYQQMIAFIHYRDLLYANKLNNKVNISNIMRTLEKKSDRKFAKRVIGTFLDLDYAKRDPTNMRVLILSNDKYRFEKEYLIPKIEKFVLNLPKNIYNLYISHSSNDFNDFNLELKKYLEITKRVITLIKYLQKGICMVKDLICPFLDSLAIVSVGNLLSYNTHSNPEFYANIADYANKFASFYRIMKEILFNPELDIYEIIILSLGPGSEINEYLPDYALQAEENDNKNVLVIPIEPEVEGFGVLSRPQILDGYLFKRQKLFNNNGSKGRLNVTNVIRERFTPIPLNIDESLKYYQVATSVLFSEGFNPVMSNKFVIVQCGISPIDCNSLFERMIPYNPSIDIYMSVRGRGNLVYKIYDKDGVVKLDEISGKKDMNWDEIKQYIKK